MGAFDLIPKPARLTPGKGGFVLKGDAAIGAPTASHGVAAWLAGLLRGATGFPLPVRAGAAGIRLRLDPTRRSTLGDEGYLLEAEASGVTITAATDAGLFWGAQTLRQLLPTQVESLRPAAGVQWAVPGVTIEDRPRFAWRGGHLDVARHFFPVEFVKRFIDLLALHKQNVFHWHLTEDQGWRLQIDNYPGLTKTGAWRDDGQGGRCGGFYTQAEAREVVAYAAGRHVTVVPEIELPGHALAALAAYPQYSCTGGPFEVGTKWGIYEDVFCAGNDGAISFLKDVLDEVLEIFPGPFVHVGGDECPKARWKACPKCQARIRAEKLADEHELQSWVIRQFDAYLAKCDRRLIGWDEILEGGLAPGAAVMSWRGTEGGLAAARAGHDVVMCPHQHVYLDYKHYEGDSEPGRLGVTSLEKVYAFDPTIPELKPAEAEHVLGVQANVWTEGPSTPAEVEMLTWPRMGAVAEMAWTPQASREFGDFRARLKPFGARLEALGVNYYRDRAVWG